MSSRAQQEVVKNFKLGKSHLLIATSVAEEGLDIKACNCVFRYNYTTNEIGRVQAKGQFRGIFTARKPSLGQGMFLHLSVILLATQGLSFPACITGHMIRGSASKHPEGRTSRTPPWVCLQEVCIGGGGWSSPTKIHGIWSTSRWYTSYWNAF